MAKFRFALQRVLDRRLDEEEVRRRALARIEGQRRALEDSLRTRQAEISAGRDAWRAGLVGQIDATALRHHAVAGVGLMRKAQRTVLEMAGLEKGLAKARAELVESARARRALEILREQRLAAHVARESRREREALDELALVSVRRNAADEAAAQAAETNP